MQGAALAYVAELALDIRPVGGHASEPKTASLAACGDAYCFRISLTIVQ